MLIPFKYIGYQQLRIIMLLATNYNYSSLIIYRESIINCCLYVTNTMRASDLVLLLWVMKKIIKIIEMIIS